MPLQYLEFNCMKSHPPIPTNNPCDEGSVQACFNDTNLARVNPFSTVLYNFVLNFRLVKPLVWLVCCLHSPHKWWHPWVPTPSFCNTLNQDSENEERRPPELIGFSPDPKSFTVQRWEGGIFWENLSLNPMMLFWSLLLMNFQSRN